MFTSWEIAGKYRANDPKMYNHKKHSAGFNAEVAVSIKESRCMWINGPGFAGEDTDLHSFRKEGGFKEKLLEIEKKVIADGGYRGEPTIISTPNSHDSASVQKFKARALKRHEKFNSMIKTFWCVAGVFCHTADTGNKKWITCFKLSLLFASISLRMDSHSITFMLEIFSVKINTNSDSYLI